MRQRKDTNPAPAFTGEFDPFDVAGGAPAREKAHMRGFRRWQSFLRRALFHVHFWGSALAGFYIIIVCVTGAVLVFGIELQQAEHPHLFTPGGRGRQAHPADVLERLRDAYPTTRVSSVEAPTATRPTHLAPVEREGRIFTLVLDPVTTEMLGELPERSYFRTFQALHADLQFGKTGRTVNGVGALLLFVLCVSGLVMWWPGRNWWRRSFTVDVRNPTRMIRDLHGVVGIWTVALIMVWALTGIYFVFASHFESALNRIAPAAVSGPPLSDPTQAGTESRPTWRALIDAAQTHMPDQFVARVVLPSSDREAFHVLFSEAPHAPANTARLNSVYLDQFTGKLLRAQKSDGAVADVLTAWMGPIHAGNFAGTGVKIAWFILGFAPLLLYGTGLAMWCTRKLLTTCKH